MTEPHHARQLPTEALEAELAMLEATLEGARRTELPPSHEQPAVDADHTAQIDPSPVDDR